VEFRLDGIVTLHETVSASKENMNFINIFWIIIKDFILHL